MGDKQDQQQQPDPSVSDQDEPSPEAPKSGSPKPEPDPGSSSPDLAAQRLRQTLAAVGQNSAQLKGRGDWVYKENNNLKAQVKELLEKNAELNNEVQSLRVDINFATTELETVNKALLGLMDPPPLAE